MKIINNKLIISVVIAVLTIGFTGFNGAYTYAATSPTLTGAGSYSVLGATTVTNTGPTTTSGDVGVTPGTAITGFPPGIAGGNNATHLHSNDASAIAAQSDNVSTFGALDQTCDFSYPSGQDLTLLSPLVPGTYCSVGSFLLTGNLTLSGSGVWIFKTVSSLVTSPGSSVTGGDPCNVWWRIGSSASLDTTTSFIGNILALTSITLNTGATLNGRALAQTGSVTLDSNVITGSTCLTAPFIPTPTVPTLPNTGLEMKNNGSWTPWITSIVTIFIVSLSTFVIRKKVLFSKRQ